MSGDDNGNGRLSKRLQGGVGAVVAAPAVTWLLGLVTDQPVPPEVAAAFGVGLLWVANLIRSRLGK